MSGSGTIPPTMTGMSTPRARVFVDDKRCQCHVRARQHRQADGVDVFVDGGGSNGRGGLEQAGVDDLVAGVAQDAGDHLDAAVVTVEADLGDEDALRDHRRAIRSPSDCRHFDVSTEHGSERGHDFAECGVDADGVDQRRHQVDLRVGGFGLDAAQRGVDCSLVA